MKKNKIEEEIKKLVVARLEAMPKSIRIFIGDHAKMDKEELIKHVKKGDPLGEKIVKMHLLYLQSFKKYAKIGMSYSPEEKLLEREVIPIEWKNIKK